MAHMDVMKKKIIATLDLHRLYVFLTTADKAGIANPADGVAHVSESKRDLLPAVVDEIGIVPLFAVFCLSRAFLYAERELCALFVLRFFLHIIQYPHQNEQQTQP